MTTEGAKVPKMPKLPHTEYGTFGIFGAAAINSGQIRPFSDLRSQALSVLSVHAPTA